MTARMCFDTESDYIKREIGIESIEYHRDCMEQFVQRGGKIRFDGGVIYDEAEDRYHEFTGDQAGMLVAMLATADELISHSGSRHDLIILEQICGAETIAPIFQIPHHDLLDVCGWAALDSLTQRYAGDRVAQFEGDHQRRLCDINVRYPPVDRPHYKNWTNSENWLARKIAKARFDVERTYAVWRAVSKEGGANRSGG